MDDNELIERLQKQLDDSPKTTNFLQELIANSPGKEIALKVLKMWEQKDGILETAA